MMKMSFRFLILATGLLAVASATQAVERYVALDNAANAASPFTSWATAATNIQDAVDVSVGGEVIWVAPGTYSVSTNAGVGYDNHTNVVTISGMSLTLRSSSGAPEDTIIDGAGLYRGIYPRAGFEERIVIDGFTISNGWAPNGAGIQIPAENSRTVEVVNCIIRDNTAASGGGGVDIRDIFGDNARSIDYTISNCLFVGNQITNGSGGGAVYDGLRGGAAAKRERIVDCTIVSNSASGHLFAAGGVYFRQPQQALVQNSVFKHNRGEGTSRGGAIFSRFGNLSIRNCLITANRGDWGSALYVVKNSSTTVENSTIAANEGNAVTWQDPENTLRLYNTILYDDSVRNINTMVANNSCLDPGITVFSGSNNITSDPLFVDSANHNFRLSRQSPCINAGTNQSWMAGAVDLDGNRRVDGVSNTVDMGAYEYVFAGTMLLVR